jgi:hypothetical protein
MPASPMTAIIMKARTHLIGQSSRRAWLQMASTQLADHDTLILIKLTNGQRIPSSTKSQTRINRARIAISIRNTNPSLKTGDNLFLRSIS